MRSYTISNARVSVDKQISVNVYDIPGSQESNSWLFHTGLGFYHTGVEIKEPNKNSVEYSYTTSGIQKSPPRLEAFGKFRVTIIIGIYTGTAQDIIGIVNKLSHGLFKNDKYNLIELNCNHFTEIFCKELVSTFVSLPLWINRAANIGNNLSLGNVIKSSTSTASNANSTRTTSTSMSSIGNTSTTITTTNDTSTNNHNQLKTEKNVLLKENNTNKPPDSVFHKMFNYNSKENAAGGDPKTKIIKSNEKKELTDKQKEMLKKLKKPS